MVVLSLMTATVRRTIHADNHGARAADTVHRRIRAGQHLVGEFGRDLVGDPGAVQVGGVFVRASVGVPGSAPQTGGGVGERAYPG